MDACNDFAQPQDNSLIEDLLSTIIGDTASLLMQQANVGVV